jgi:DNA processing protein
LAPRPEVEDWLTLSFLPGLGCTLINHLVQQLGTPAAVLQNADRVTSLPRVGARLAATLRDGQLLVAARARAQAELALIDRLGTRLLTPSSPEYPPALRTIADCPVVLYCRGHLNYLQRRAVAIIGSRSASDYGKRIATGLAAELAIMGITIVSGAAYGIDAAAHGGAMAAGGATVGVLGCGLDVIYPRSHANLFRDITDKGLLISEYPFGTQPEGFRFPARNRIISGLVEGVVVVEATEKSGSLITARLALDQGREVFAVPGRIDSPKSAGTHRLIQQGAYLVHTVDDILIGLAWNQPNRSSAPERPLASDGCELTAQEGAVLAQLDIYPRDIETIGRITGLSLAELHGLLLQLELKGLVRQLPGQQYECLGLPDSTGA